MEKQAVLTSVFRFEILSWIPEMLTGSWKCKMRWILSCPNLLFFRRFLSQLFKGNWNKWAEDEKKNTSVFSLWFPSLCYKSSSQNPALRFKYVLFWSSDHIIWSPLSSLHPCVQLSFLSFKSRGFYFLCFFILRILSSTYFECYLGS